MRNNSQFSTCPSFKLAAFGEALVPGEFIKLRATENTLSNWRIYKAALK
jgi:hypothetical protein